MKLIDYPTQMQTKQNAKPPLSDAVFMHSIYSSAITMLVCIVMLSATTWAWFTGSVATGNNQIATTLYDLTIQLEDSEGNVVGGILDASVMTYSLEANETYTATLSAVGSGNGYCIITVGDDQPLYTDLVPAQDSSRNPTTLTLHFTEDTIVSFTCCWGIYDGPADVYQGDTLPLITE